MSWKIAAEIAGKRIECFFKPEEFFEKAHEFEKKSAIYIDVQLKDGVRGQDVAEKLASLGFVNLYLATGYEPDQVEKPICVRAVIGKEAPL